MNNHIGQVRIGIGGQFNCALGIRCIKRRKILRQIEAMVNTGSRLNQRQDLICHFVIINDHLWRGVVKDMGQFIFAKPAVNEHKTQI